MNVYEAINARRTIRDFADRPVDMSIIEKIIDAGLKAPTNDHMRSWEFVVVSRDKRTELLNTLPKTYSKVEVGEWLDTWSEDSVQRDMYLDGVPKQYTMLHNAGCLILPFYHEDEPLLEPKSLSSLNNFASIWCCIENILLAAAAEGIFGVTRIPMDNEIQHIQKVVGHPNDYVMPCYIALGYPAKDATRPVQKEVLARDRIRVDAW